MTTRLLENYAKATAEFDARVRAVGDDQWGNETPCEQWDVRTLVNHLVSETSWVPSLMHGSTIAEVGDRFDGDLLGADPVRSWSEASAGASAAIAEDGALTRHVHLSYGDVVGSSYAWDLTTDLTIHAWDLAQGIGVDSRLDPELVEAIYARLEPMADQLAASGLFAPPVQTPADADPQTKLLALTGRSG